MSVERSRYDWPKLIERLGISTFYTCGLLYGGWCGLQWIAPRMDNIVNKHLEFVDKAGDIMKENKETQQRNTKILETLSAEQVSHNGISSSHLMTTERIREKVDSIGSDVTEIKKKVLQ